MNQPVTSHNRIWMILHALVVLGIPLFLILVSSCIKAPELKQGDLGVEASEDDLERVISKALYGIDPWKTAVGQQVVYDFNARIENQEQVRPLLRLTQTIRSRKDECNGQPAQDSRCEGQRKLTLIIENHELDANTGEVDRSESPPVEYTIGKAPGPLMLRNFTRPFEIQNLDKWAEQGRLTQVVKFFSLSEFRSPEILADRPVQKVTYHNLREESGFMTPPAAVMEKPACAGVPDCRLRYMLIAYDEATWFSSSDYELRKWHFVISRDAPFLGYIVERCLASMVQGEGRRHYVRQCQFTRDFSYADAQAP